jgi:hypothetical protein
MQHVSDLLCPPAFRQDSDLLQDMQFMSGFNQPAREDDTQRVAARHGFVVELLYNRKLTRACPGNDSEPTEEEARLICPDADLFDSATSELVARCDMMYRGSKQASPRPHFEDACSCYRSEFSEPFLPANDSPDGSLDDIDLEVSFKAFAEAVCGKVLPEDAYGVAGGTDQLKDDCMQNLRQARHENQMLIGMMKGIGNGPSEHQHLGGTFESRDEIVRKVDRCIRQSTPDTWRDFNHYLDAREMSLRNARDAFDLLQIRVNEHVANRRKRDDAHLIEMSDDAFARMAQFLNTTSAVALMATCVQYSRNAALKARMPQMHVRFIAGNFPHHRAVSRDREALSRNKLQPVVRDFVLTRQAVRLHVDFVIPTLRAKPLKKKDRADGLSNIDHDLSDDEYEEPPESLRLRGPQVSSSNNNATDWGRRLADGERRVRAQWMAAEGPEEKLDRFMYNKRIPYNSYFTAPLQISLCLVYADSKEPVQCSRFKGGLDLSNQMLRDRGLFSQPPTYRASDQMPASCKFHVPHLSSDHANKLFCLRLTGTAWLHRSGAPFTQVVYTQPFEVVSKLDVVKKAAKRRTAEQVSEDAAKRAKSKSAKKQPATGPPRLLP